MQWLSRVPLRDVFGLVFFVSVGMLFDPRYLAAHAPQVALMVASIIVGKALICCVTIVTRILRSIS